MRRALALVLLLLCAGGASAQPAPQLDVYLFWAEGCPHCRRAIDFLKGMEKAEPRLRAHILEVSRDAANQAAFAAVAKRLEPEEPAVPLIAIGEDLILGYDSDATSGAELRRRIGQCLASACPDMVGPLLRVEGRAQAPANSSGARRVVPQSVAVPFLGEVHTADLSLPLLTILLGALDGFNPCAMWVLVFLIGLLLGMQDRVRMWTLGAAFIAGSALVYFLFMAAWLNFLLFLGSVVWVRAAIGVVALGGGLYYLREYFQNAGATCKVTAPEARRRVFDKLRALARERRFWLALAGMLALAVAVNLVELLCSAGIPAVYTQVLALSQLPPWQYYAYLALYVLVFMLDDLFVFVVAMQTLHLTGATTRFAHFSNLAGGLVLLAIGALLLLRPELLMFG